MIHGLTVRHTRCPHHCHISTSPSTPLPSQEEPQSLKWLDWYLNCKSNPFARLWGMYVLVCPITSSKQHRNQQRKRLDNCIMVESLWLLLGTHLAVPRVLQLPLSHAYTLFTCNQIKPGFPFTRQQYIEDIHYISVPWCVIGSLPLLFTRLSLHFHFSHLYVYTTHLILHRSSVPIISIYLYI